jgi:hypothetical protein
LAPAALLLVGIYGEPFSAWLVQGDIAEEIARALIASIGLIPRHPDLLARLPGHLERGCITLLDPIVGAHVNHQP